MAAGRTGLDQSQGRAEAAAEAGWRGLLERPWEGSWGERITGVVAGSAGRAADSAD